MTLLPGAAQILARGLSAASLRHAAISHNLANLNTPGFQRQSVAFESLLQEALQAGRPLADVTPVLRTEAGAGKNDGGGVDLDYEMAQLAANQVWYAALSRNLQGQLERLRIAVTEGRR